MLEQLLNHFPQNLHEQATSCFNQFEAKRQELVVETPFSEMEYLEIIRVLSCSDFILQFLNRKPEWIFSAFSNGDYHSSKKLSDWQRECEDLFQEQLTLPIVAQNIREYRNQQMIRIAWRDLAGNANIEESMYDLSQLADHCIKGALNWLNEKQKIDFGTPVDSNGRELQMIILGMGKLGAYELNFSSDIDLIFVFPEHGNTINGKRSTSNNEYFIKLGQQLIKLLNDRSAHGFVFRVDMRLRPFGQSGPLAITIDAMENYFATHGREWERYAMIKARMITGDDIDKKVLEKLLKPFIYRRYIDFGVFESLREMKGMIAHEVKQKRMEHNIKLGTGGIREIEFLAQAFQLLRGGRETELQERRVQKVIHILAERDSIPQYVADDLLNAYVFLRKTEHCIQEVNDQQTHLLPDYDYPKSRLAFAMGYQDWETFSEQLEQHRKQVETNFSQLFQAPQIESEQSESQSEQDCMSILWRKTLHNLEEDETEQKENAISLIENAGYKQAADILDLLLVFRRSSNYRKMSSKGRERLDNLMPMILNALSGNEQKSEMQTAALKRLLDVFETTCRRSVYLALLIENPLALSQLIKLCSSSAWIARELTRIPALLDELLDPRVLYSPLNKIHLQQDLEQRLATVEDDDLEQRMEIMRHFKQTHSLRVAAADTTDVLPVMKVSDYLTWIAETVLDQVILTAWHDTAKKLGTPQYHPEHPLASQNEVKPGQGFAILGFGKVGGLELGYGSDLDLVFIYDDCFDKGTTNGEKSAQNGLFFTRMGQRIMHILGTRTYSGILYECDMRLRPNGNSGLVATTLQTFKKYELEKAWLWEHQALCRARIVAGDETALGQAYLQARQEVLAQPREVAELRQKVHEMRLKMRHSLEKKKAGHFDVKQAAGGIVDIEFMVQFLVLQFAHQHPEVIRYTDNIRMLESLLKAHVIEETFGHSLIEIYQKYRDFMHAQALQEVPGLAEDGLFTSERQQINHFWQELMES